MIVDQKLLCKPFFKIFATKVILFCFIIIFYLRIAFSLGLDTYDGGPDEVMRSLLPRCIINGNLLPSGYDECAIHIVGNWSYAFYPQMISAYLSAFFMFIARALGADNSIIFMSGRLASICFSFIALLAVSRTVEIVCARCKHVFLFECVAIILLAFWPQYAFLSSYMNNDIVATAGVAVLIYALVSGMKLGWRNLYAIIFAVGVMLCGLGYWNSYGFILVFVVIFIFSVFLQRQNNIKKSFQIVGLAAIVSAVLVIPWFIINIVRYGDLTGMSVFRARMNEWIIANGRTDGLQHPYIQGVRSLLLDTDWVDSVLHSFVGNLGYMAIEMPFVFVVLYYLIIGIGFGFVLVNFSARWRSINYRMLVGGSVVGSFITVGLSLYYSTRVDYQPQGRYIIYLLIPLVIMVISGLSDSFKFHSKYSVLLIIVICCIYIAICLYFYRSTIVEYGWEGVQWSGDL